MDDPDIVDGELLPDETPDQVERRLARRPTSAIQIDAPGGTITVLIDDEVRDQFRLDPEQLYCGLYNRTGAVPSAMELRPSWDWDEEERRAMGLPPKVPTRPLLTGDTLARPFRVVERCGLAPLTRGRHGTHRARAQIIATSFISHFTIGSRARGILVAGEFDTPIKVAQGSTITLGLRLQEAIDASRAPALPIERPRLGDGTEEGMTDTERRRQALWAARRADPALHAHLTALQATWDALPVNSSPLAPLDLRVTNGAREPKAAWVARARAAWQARLDGLCAAAAAFAHDAGTDPVDG